MDTKSKISTKLFLGCKITPDIRLQLNQNNEWQQLVAIPDTNTENLKELHYQEKEYFGKFLDDEKPTLTDLREAEQVIIQALESYCPQSNIKAIKLVLFPQIFLA